MKRGKINVIIKLANFGSRGNYIMQYLWNFLEAEGSSELESVKGWTLGE